MSELPTIFPLLGVSAKDIALRSAGARPRAGGARVRAGVARSRIVHHRHVAISYPGCLTPPVRPRGPRRALHPWADDVADDSAYTGEATIASGADAPASHR